MDELTSVIKKHQLLSIATYNSKKYLHVMISKFSQTIKRSSTFLTNAAKMFYLVDFMHLLTVKSKSFKNYNAKKI